MTRRFTGPIAAAAFALYAAAGVAAYAQPAPGPDPHAEHHEQRVVVMRHGMDSAKHAEHLRAILQLKPSQEAALTAYVASMKPPGHGEMEHMGHKGGMDHPKTTPERLADMDKMMSEHVAAMRAQMDATRKFYDQLDPAQKKAFDELPMMMQAHMGGGMMTMMVHKGPEGMGGMPPMPPHAPPPPPAHP